MLYEKNMEITGELREEVMKDTGVVRLRQKVLDLITQLRLEAKVIITKKKLAKA